MKREPAVTLEDDGANDGRTTLPIDRRRFIRTSAVAGAAVASGIGTANAAAEGTVSLIHDTHFHGRFEGVSGVDIAQYTQYVNGLREDNANSAFVGIGDDFSPSVMGFEFHGEHMVAALNYLDPVVDGVGNHEFDFGIDNAVERFENSRFPWVVANLLTPEGEPIPGTKRWTIESVGDYRVGFFGSGVEDFHAITAYPEDYIALDPVEAATEAVSALQGKDVDLVVMASHTESRTHDEIAQQVDGLDAIVGSHSGIVQEEARVVSGTVISELGDQFGWLGEVHLDPKTGDLVELERHDLAGRADSLPEDGGMREIMDEWLGKLDDRLGQPVFRTATELDARFSTNYAVESGLGNLVCDVMREEMDAAIGLQNPGGIRSNATYGPGAITGTDVYNVLPFPNRIVKAEVTGKALRETLEVSVSALPWSSFGIQAGTQVSGLQYEFSGTGESVVTNFSVNGDPLRDDETYTLATNDYVFDNWAGFADATLLETTEDFLGTVFIEHLRRDGVVEPDVDNRLLRVDEDVGVADVERGEGTVTVVTDRPATAERVYGETFKAVTAYGHEIEAQSAEERGESVAITFDYEDLSMLASGPKNPDLRVFGGFDPDEAAYGYETDDGSLRELPVAMPVYYFTMKAAVPTNGRGPNPFGGNADGHADDHDASKSANTGADGGATGRRGRNHGHHRH